MFVRLALIFWIILVACSPIANSAATGIVIEWTTATEINTAGFNVYRSAQADGPYTKINADLIRGSSDPISGGKYRYNDTDVIPGKTYYYRLEDVELNGDTTQHGPLQITAQSTAVVSAVTLLFGTSILVVIATGALLVRRRAKNRGSGSVEKAQ